MHTSDHRNLYKCQTLATSEPLCHYSPPIARKKKKKNGNNNNTNKTEQRQQQPQQNKTNFCLNILKYIKNEYIYSKAFVLTSIKAPPTFE